MNEVAEAITKRFTRASRAANALVTPSRVKRKRPLCFHVSPSLAATFQRFSLPRSRRPGAPSRTNKTAAKCARDFDEIKSRPRSLFVSFFFFHDVLSKTSERNHDAGSRKRLQLTHCTLGDRFGVGHLVHTEIKVLF